jgi:hypothetical protein
MRVWSCIALAAVAVVASSAPASACILMENQLALIHSAVPADLPRALVVVQADIPPTATQSQLYEAGLRARVSRTIQGDYRGPFIRLRASVQTSCDGPFDNGRSGLVVGYPRGWEDGELVIEPILAQRSDGFRLAEGYELSPYYTEPGYLKRVLKERAEAVAKLNGPAGQSSSSSPSP